LQHLFAWQFFYRSHYNSLGVVVVSDRVWIVIGFDRLLVEEHRWPDSAWREEASACSYTNAFMLWRKETLSCSSKLLLAEQLRVLNKLPWGKRLAVKHAIAYGCQRHLLEVLGQRVVAAVVATLPTYHDGNVNLELFLTTFALLILWVIEATLNVSHSPPLHEIVAHSSRVSGTFKMLTSPICLSLWIAHISSRHGILVKHATPTYCVFICKGIHLILFLQLIDFLENRCTFECCFTCTASCATFCSSCSMTCSFGPLCCRHLWCFCFIVVGFILLIGTKVLDKHLNVFLCLVFHYNLFVILLGYEAF